jgi:protein-tyrosine phosphatase
LFNKILIVCTGNICRSPAAEYILRQQLENGRAWRGAVRSAGTGALVNHPADETTEALLLADGLDLKAHRSVQLTLEQLRWANLVLVMEKRHRQEVLDIDPAARGKIFLLGHWLDVEIPDPFRRGQQAHVDALRLIRAAIALWLDKFRANV